MATEFDYGWVAGYHDLYVSDRNADFSSGYPTSPSARASLGNTGPEGIRVTVSRSFSDITSDAYGDSVLDAIYTGGNCVIEFALQVVNTDGVRELLSTYRDTAAVLPTATPRHNEVGAVGTTASTWGMALMAEPRIGTPAALAHGGVASRVFLGHPFGDFTESLDLGHSIIPIRFRCLPFVESGVGTELMWWDWYGSPS